jgi:hypothetical protein
MMAASVRSRAGDGPPNKAATSITGMLSSDMVLRWLASNLAGL